MSLPVPRKPSRLPAALREKLASTIRASMNELGARTQLDYTRGLVVFAQWLERFGAIELPQEPPPRSEGRHAWEDRARDAAGAYLFGLEEHTANLVCDTYVRDLLGHEKDGQFFGDPVARKTAHKRLSALRWAVRVGQRLGEVSWRLTTRMPAVKKDEAGRLIEKQGRDMRGPTLEQAAALVAAANDPEHNDGDRRYPPIVSLLRWEGYREHEVRQINVEDLDLDGRTVMITRKKRSAPHPMPLSPMSVEAIRTWLSFRPGAPDHGPLFTGGYRGRSAGQRIGQTQIWRMLARLCESADFGFVTSPHKLRHRACTDIVDAGRRRRPPIAEERLLLLTGHSSRGALQPYYDATEDLTDAWDVLASLPNLYETET